MHWHAIILALFGSGTWGAGGNLIAWVICGVLGAVGAFLLRRLIGRHLAAWWSVHHGPHAIEQHMEALRRHEAEKRAGTDDLPDHVRHDR